MRAAVRTAGVLALVFMISACGGTHHGDDPLTRRFGSDWFGMGDTLSVTDTVAGDAFLAGADVSTAAEIQGDLAVAGGNVSVGGSIGDDLYAAGGHVQLDAIVTGNARLAGGEVVVGPATDINGALTLTGGELRFDGTTHGYLHATGGRILIDGNVAGDAEIRADEVELGPNARIAGKLVVRGPHEPVVAQGAQVAGGVEYHEEDSHVRVARNHVSYDLSDATHGVGSVLWIVGVFIAGGLFTLAFPAYSARAADWIGQAPLRSLGLGFVVLVCLPILVVLLLVTIVGIPLALIVLALYLLLLFLGWVTAALFVGRKGLELLRGAEPASAGWRLGALLAAVVALWLVGKVPYVGGWITFIALLLGIGALVWQGWPGRGAPPAAGRASVMPPAALGAA